MGASDLEKIDMDWQNTEEKFFWSHGEIMKFLQYILHIVKRFGIDKQNTEGWEVWKNLEIETCRALAASFLYRDLKEEPINIRNLMVQIKRSVIKDKGSL